jgi:hypothetical protein
MSDNNSQERDGCVHMYTKDEVADSFEISIQQVSANRVLITIGRFGHRTSLSINNTDAEALAHNILLMAR